MTLSPLYALFKQRKRQTCALLALCEGIPPVSGGFSSQRTSDAESCVSMPRMSFYLTQVGEVLAISVGVRHRSLTQDWYLKSVSVCNLERTKVLHFPFHNFVHAKVTLRPGDGKMVMIMTVYFPKNYTWYVHYKHCASQVKYICDLVQGYAIPSALKREMLQPCAKNLVYWGCHIKCVRMGRKQKKFKITKMMLSVKKSIKGSSLIEVFQQIRYGIKYRWVSTRKT